MPGLAACNPIEGAGQNLEAAGEGIADTAEDAADRSSWTPAIAIQAGGPIGLVIPLT